MNILNQVIPVKFILILILASLLVGIFTESTSFSESKHVFKENLRDELARTAILISSQFSADDIQGINSSDEQATRYAALKNKLHKIRTEREEFTRVQIWRISAINETDLVDDSQDPGEAGTIHLPDPVIIQQILQSLPGSAADKEYSYEGPDITLTGYAPIVNSQGETIAIVGVTMKVEDIIGQMDHASEGRTEPVFLFLIIGLILIVASPVLIEGIYKPKKLFQQLFQHSANGILIIQNQRIREVNEATLKMADLLGIGTDR